MCTGHSIILKASVKMDAMEWNGRAWAGWRLSLNQIWISAVQTLPCLHELGHVTYQFWASMFSFLWRGDALLKGLLGELRESIQLEHMALCLACCLILYTESMWSWRGNSRWQFSLSAGGKRHSEKIFLKYLLCIYSHMMSKNWMAYPWCYQPEMFARC